MKKAGLMALVLVAAVAGAAYAGLMSDSWRYKMTVEVETPEGIRTGSSVREVTVKKGLKLTPEMRRSIELEGEAIVVDLGKRGVLFALLRGAQYGQSYAPSIFLDIFKGKDKNGKVLLDPQQYPTFIRFRDPKDAKTVEIVYPDKLEDMFGNGVHIKSVIIETTEEVVTKGQIAGYLPSYGEETEFMQWINSLSYNDPRRFGPDAFRRSAR